MRLPVAVVCCLFVQLSVCQQQQGRKQIVRRKIQPEARQDPDFQETRMEKEELKEREDIEGIKEKEEIRMEGIKEKEVETRRPKQGKVMRKIKKMPGSSNHDQAESPAPPGNRTGGSNVPAKPTDAKRFLSLFTVVSFANDVCVSSSGANGTCYSKKDCEELGGHPAGPCASGFGTCCLITATCGGSTSVNGSYFTSIGYPSTFDSVGSCQLTVNKCHEDVCQLRLDIENMILSQPELTDHKCESDQFIVTGGSSVPAICGVNSGAHMYVDMGLSSNSPVVLTVVTTGTSFPRSFSIKITQIECYSLAKGSTGCLQHFTGVSGRVFSFNYNEGTGLMLSDTDYSICVRIERNFCGIQYSACEDQANEPSQSFSLTGGFPRDGSRVGTQCSTDWLTIPCATNTIDPNTQNGTPLVCVDRICGMVFNSATTQANTPNVPVYSFAKPFNIFVHTDSAEGTSSPSESNNRGFCLNFIQQPCTSAKGKK